MQLVVGNATFDPNSTEIAVRGEVLWNAGNQPYAVRRFLAVRGYLSGNGQDALILAESALKTALLQPSPNVAFLADDGTVAEALTNAGAITPVRLTRGPDFTTTHGPEFATLRSYSFEFTAEYPLPNTANLYLSFRETLTRSGGLPTYIHRRAINGPPQKQLVYPATEFVVVQQGSAVGYRAYPPPQPPLFPFALKEAPHVSQVTPERRGPLTYQGFETTWSYTFEDIGPLPGFPSLWPV